MASGKLLVLIGEECKRQDQYFNLDKEYEFEVLFGVGSDTGDVLGLVETGQSTELDLPTLNKLATKLQGSVELPYPAYSSKTVQGKPLHTWAMEGKLSEITIPTKQSTVYSLKAEAVQSVSKETVYQTVTAKIEMIPLVTDSRKALGNDFRRPDIRVAWKAWYNDPKTPGTFQIARFRCVSSSGTYMRTLAGELGKAAGTNGLAYSIHRTKIGRYQPLLGGIGIWYKTFS